MRTKYALLTVMAFSIPAQGFGFENSASAQADSEKKHEKTEAGEGTGKVGRAKPGRWLDGLKVNREQRVKIREIRLKKKADAEKHREELKLLGEELKNILAGDGQAEKAREIHKRMQDVQRELGDAHFESMLAVRDLLTPEQRLRFVETMKLRSLPGFRAR